MDWNQVNEDRKNLKVAVYRDAFPNAKDDINFETLVEVNQYKATITNVDELARGGSHLPDVGSDKRLQKYMLDFQSNYDRHETETHFNASLFYSMSDTHNSLMLHNDYETVLLIQGYGQVAYLVTDKDTQEKTIYTLNPGDAILLPRLTNHKPMIIGPRVTLSLGANPMKAMNTKPYGPVNTSM